MDKYYKFVSNDLLRINTIWCVGRNYSEHAKEMGAKTENEPIIFLKPNSSALLNNKIVLPEYSNDVHFETEIVFVVGEDAKDISETDALNVISGVGVGLDLTLRDIQSELKKKSLPWALSKSFANSAPLSRIVPIKDVNVSHLEFEMYLNSKLTQKAHINEMVFSINQIIAYISSRFSLQKGDCIFTGTPAGVGKLQSKDKIFVSLQNILEWNLEVL